VEASTPIIAIFLCCVCPSLCFLCCVCRRLWWRPSRPSSPFPVLCLPIIVFLVLCLQASLAEAFTPIIAFFLCCACPTLCFLCCVCRRLWWRPSRPSSPFPVLCLPIIVFLVLCLQASLVEAFTPIIAFFLCCVCSSLCFLCCVCRRLWWRPLRPSLPFQRPNPCCRAGRCEEWLRSR